MTSGYQTSEFWITLITQMASALIPLLILYGVINNEQGAAWQALIVALAAVLVPLVLGSVAKSYSQNRTELKVEAMHLADNREEGSFRAARGECDA